MIRKASSWFKELSKAGKSGLIVTTVVGLLALGAATDGNQKSAQINLDASKSGTSQSKDTVEHKTVTTTENIPFATTNSESSSLAKGATETQVEGINGVRTHTYNVAYTNGVESSRVEVSSVVTTQPVNKVITVGTYVAPAQPTCPNGTYTNTAGNVVCSPYASNSAPAGATAQCSDGTYSFSQSRSGTCSHHGGVASWL